MPHKGEKHKLLLVILNTQSLRGSTKVYAAYYTQKGYINYMYATRATPYYITFGISDVNFSSSILHLIKQDERYLISKSSWTSESNVTAFSLFWRCVQRSILTLSIRRRSLKP